MKINIWTDGACSGNPGPGGWAWLRKVNLEEEERNSGSEKETTNNIMELRAVIEALRDLYEDYPHTKDIRESFNVTIYTDSTYVKEGMESWIENWKKNSWKTSGNKPVKNRELWEELDRFASFYDVSWKWVKAHTETTDPNHSKENAIVDSLARDALSNVD